MITQDATISQIINHSLQAHCLARELAMRPVMEALELTIVLAEIAQARGEPVNRTLVPIPV